VLKSLPLLPYATARMACVHCGQEHRSVELPAGNELRCVRCDMLLEPPKSSSEARLLALAVTGLLALIPALWSPLLITAKWGSRYDGSVWQSAMSFLRYEQNLVATLVFFACIIAPLGFFVAATLVGLPVWRGDAVGRRICRRIALFLGEWAMVEVFLLALAVCFVKLDTVARVYPKPGLFFAAIVAVCLILVRRLLLDPRESGMRDDKAPAAGCHVCLSQLGFPNEVPRGGCPSCGATVTRDPHPRLARTWAFWLAAIFLLVPANVVPVMETNSAKGVRLDTIFSGVVALFRDGNWGVALIVFTASILVPVMKLSGLAYVLLRIHRPAPEEHRPRLVRLHHGLVTIGRWSMLDVFLVGFLAAVVQFGFGGQVIPKPGVLAFAGVVVFTMLAAGSVDLRALWPREPRNESAA
jgi:paraquat-inducible protein A